jgi:hypothetical protein
MSRFGETRQLVVGVPSCTGPYNGSAIGASALPFPVSEDTPMLRIFHGGALAAMLLAALAADGCREPESIQTYDTPRTEPRPQRLDVDTARARLDHMFAAVVPDGDKAWFFKLVAPAKAAESLRKPFDEFVASIELVDGKTPNWKLAEGWREKPGDQMRAATIEIPQEEGESLELAVSTLPLEGEWAAYLDRNVNRWMGQLQQAPLKREVVEKITRKTPIKNGEATVVELVGVMDRQGAMPAGHPPVAEMPKEKASPSTAPVTSAPPAAQSAELTYDAPAHWQAGPPSAMRKASFAVLKDDAKADLSVTAFPAVEMMADPVANARRWAGEVGMATESDAELEKLMTDTKIDKLPGKYMEFIPTAGGEQAQATLAAMVKRGERMWFFKLKGDRAAVEGERDAFRKFLESVRFPAK